MSRLLAQGSVRLHGSWIVKHGRNRAQMLHQTRSSFSPPQPRLWVVSAPLRRKEMRLRKAKQPAQRHTAGDCHPELSELHPSLSFFHNPPGSRTLQGYAVFK